MRRPPPICDVPGCGCSRLRRQRLCERCWRRLTGELRVGINEAHHQRRWADWRALTIRAAAFLNIAAAPARPTPERFQARQAAMLGERP